jgi:hypothetical protein
MIRDLLVPAVQQAFPDKLFVVSSTPHPVLKLGSGCTDVGDLAIYDDGQEATVSITEITHGHFGPNDENLTRDEIDAQVTEDVICFLHALFSDHVLLYRTPERNMGGWSIFEDAPNPDELVAGREYFLWSGPYKK